AVVPTVVPVLPATPALTATATLATTSAVAATAAIVATAVAAATVSARTAAPVSARASALATAAVAAGTRTLVVSHVLAAPSVIVLVRAVGRPVCGGRPRGPRGGGGWRRRPGSGRRHSTAQVTRRPGPSFSGVLRKKVGGQHPVAADVPRGYGRPVAAAGDHDANRSDDGHVRPRRPEIIGERHIELGGHDDGAFRQEVQPRRLPVRRARRGPRQRAVRQPQPIGLPGHGVLVDVEKPSLSRGFPTRGDLHARRRQSPARAFRRRRTRKS